MACNRSRGWFVVAAFLALAALLTSCSSDDDSGGAADDTVAPTTAAPAESLRVLVTNDDGVDAPGIDAVVQALAALPDTEVVVVAPRENQSGTGGQTTAGALTATDATTASGYPAKAVDGFPADTIVWAFDQGGIEVRPHLVISGINTGQNLGPVADISGTVGAARAAVARGIPALAASQGLADQPDFASGVDEVLSWLELHRAELLAGTAPVAVENLNVPTCSVGTVRGVIEQPPAADLAGRDMFTVDCSSTKENFVDDVDAFVNGYAVLSDLAA
jgi:5'-nucleotidase